MLVEGLVLARATVDRGADRRGDDAWLQQRMADPTTRVLLVHDGRVPVDGDAARWLEPGAAPGDVLERSLLGVGADGTAYVALRIEQEPAGLTLRTLREMGSRFDSHDVGLVTTAVALCRWHESHQRCPHCGDPLDVVQSGWVRRCPRDGREVFPRTDPAVIALVHDGERALLGRRFDWAPNRFSTFAGFVEPGESAEMALRREIREECALEVDPAQVRYLGSQPWPFPASLMLGYHCGVHPGAAVPDGVEITDVRWFTRDELRDDVVSGAVSLPPSISIARRLIEAWVGEPLEESGDWR